MQIHNKEVLNRWAEIAIDYDKFRPLPPEKLITLLVNLTGLKILDLVVDLGCGTGLSSRPWSNHAKQIIGLDPSIDMLEIAKRNTSNSNVVYQQGYGNNTQLESTVADIVTCSSSIHWMEPETTIDEIKRILKKKGMLVIYAYNWPPLTKYLELDNEYFIFKKNYNKFIREFNLNEGFYKPIGEFATLLNNRTIYKYYREFYFHEQQYWNAQQYRLALFAWRCSEIINSKYQRRSIPFNFFD